MHIMKDQAVTGDLKSKQPAKSLETTNVNEIFQFCCALPPKLAEQGANYHVLSLFLGAETAPQRREAHNALARRVALKNCICRERSSLAIWQRCILRRWIIGAGEDEEVVVCVFIALIIGASLCRAQWALRRQNKRRLR
jgi:hypothetical protein